MQPNVFCFCFISSVVFFLVQKIQGTSRHHLLPNHSRWQNIGSYDHKKKTFNRQTVKYSKSYWPDDGNNRTILVEAREKYGKSNNENEEPVTKKAKHEEENRRVEEAKAAKAGQEGGQQMSFYEKLNKLAAGEDCSDEDDW